VHVLCWSLLTGCSAMPGILVAGETPSSEGIAGWIWGETAEKPRALHSFFVAD
jgi:hypothetical protein